MSDFLNSLVNRARGFQWDELPPEIVKDKENAVVSDSFDQFAWQMLTSMVPAINRSVRKVAQEFDYMPPAYEVACQLHADECLEVVPQRAFSLLPLAVGQEGASLAPAVVLDHRPRIHLVPSTASAANDRSTIRVHISSTPGRAGTPGLGTSPRTANVARSFVVGTLDPGDCS